MLQQTVIKNSWIPHEPTSKQAVGLTVRCPEILWGGSAGGGKTEWLLMGALQYVNERGYAALILRRTYADLALPDAIMDRAKQWLIPLGVHWNDRDKVFTFPSGATLSFGYLEHENDKYRYQGTALSFVGWDELTQFSESSYRYLFSRLRRAEGSDIPLRMRAASNPGGTGHEWVRQRFLVEKIPDRLFIPARLSDNPHLDREAYLASLAQLDPYTRQQLLEGDWFALPPGSKFRREWFPIVDAVPVGAKYVRRWDMAATEPKPGHDPDWTAGALVAEYHGVYYLCDMIRIRTTPQGNEALVKQTAEIDGRQVAVRMEQEPGSSGKSLIDHYARDVLKGWDFQGVRSTGSKDVRANPVSSAAEAGNFRLLRGGWLNDFLDEAVSFPGGAHDDQVDAVSGAVQDLTVPKLRGNRTAAGPPRSTIANLT